MGDASTPARRRLIRFASITLSLVIALFGLWALAVIAANSKPDVFGDLRIYRDATERLFSGQGWYLPEQLNGPYEFVTSRSILYPPVAAWFFLPWLVLPAWTYVAIPIVGLARFVWSTHPEPWTWPILTACIAWPMTPLLALYANPSLWIAMAVALGLRYAWPGALVLLKPSLAPFALIGIRSRGWWLTAAGLVILSLPFIGPTLEYPRVVLDAQGGGLLYSWWHAPLLLVPVVAWLGRSARTRERKGSTTASASS